MRKFYIVFLFVVLSGCETDSPYVDPGKGEKEMADAKYEQIRMNRVSKEVLKFINLQETSKSVEDSTNIFRRINFEVPVNVWKYDQNSTSYTFALNSVHRKSLPMNYYFENLVVIEHKKKKNAFIVRYTPDHSWLTESSDFRDYTGNIKYLTIDGEEEASFDKGVGISLVKKSSKSHTKSSCDMILEETGTVCTDGGSINGEGSLADYRCTTSYRFTVSCTTSGGGTSGGAPTAGPSTGGGGSRGGTSDGELDDFRNSDGTIPALPRENIIYTYELAGCLKGILDSLQGHRHGVGEIVGIFSDSNDGNYNWPLKTDVLDSGPLGQPTAETDISLSAVTSVTTTFDISSWPNGTDLSWARTILHESVHAYVVAATYNSIGDNAERQRLLGPNWATSTLYRGHEYIATDYLISMADILQEYGNLKGYTMERQFYEDLAWGGLFETPEFKSKPEEEKTRIKNICLVELTGRDKDGNSREQKGTNAGC